MDNLIGKKFVYGGDVVEVRVVDGETVAAVDSQNRVVVLKKKSLTQPAEQGIGATTSDEEQLEANRPPPALSVVWHKVLDYGPGLVTRTWFDPDFGYMARVMWQRDLEFKDHPVNRLQSLPKEP